MTKSLVAAALGAFVLGSTGHTEGTAVVLLPPETYNIVTVAGGGADTGDGGLGVAAHLDVPSGVAFDSIGNMYVPETSTYMAPLPSPLHHRVRKIDKATGIITTVAGTGAPVPYTGEYQLATLANITAPVRVLFDLADNFYINGGTGNNRIQKVDAATGLITTVAGHLNGEACPASASPPCGDGGMATDAWVTGPLQGSTFDAAGNYYFSGSNRVRKIAARVNGGVAQPLDGTETVTAFAGTGTAGYDGDNMDATLSRLSSPRSLAIDPSGENLYVADLGNHRIRKINLTTGIITTAVGMTGAACLPNTDPCGDGQPVQFARITNPTNVSFDSYGNLYVNSQSRVRKVDTSGIITTVAGTGVLGFSGDGGPARSATLNAMRGGGFDSADNYYIGDAGNNRIRRLNLAAAVGFVAETPGRVTASIQLPAGWDASLVDPDSVRLQAIASDGSVRISTTGEALQTGSTPDPPTIVSATNQLTLEFDRTAVASWAGGAAGLVLRVEGRFESGRYFSGDAPFDVSNDPPVASDDAVSTAERTPVTIAVLANDYDPDGDPIAIASVAAPRDGTVVAAGGGGLTYTPAVGFVGADSFTYAIQDGRGGRATATVNVTVTPVGQSAAVTLKMQSTQGGMDLWFNSVAKVRGAQPGSHLYVSAGSVALGATVVAVPAADISFTVAGALATTSFDPAYNLWRISVPYTFGDDIFIGGLTYLLPTAIGNSTPAAWTARFSTNTAGLTLQWKGAAAAYPPQHFGDYSALGVKTLHATSGDAYPNGDQAGTPEAFKAFVMSGGTGGGGSNATGGFSATVSVTPTVK